ncbi:MAG: dihydrofolate reductase family protein, partial [Acidimicrobiia bacterium]|nr:dihydrofolate reductase family protein [Acidimicrobiia bacterium]
AGPQPRPVVVAGSGELPSARRLWARDPLVYATRPVATPGGEVVVVSGGDRVDIDAVIKDLGSRGIVDLMVEGGPAVAHSFLTGGHVNRLVWYLAANLAGGQGRPAFKGVFATIGEAIEVEIIGSRMVGADLRVDAEMSGV